MAVSPKPAHRRTHERSAGALRKAANGPFPSLAQAARRQRRLLRRC